MNASHSHTQSQKLQRKGFACATGADEVEVRVFIPLGIEKVHDTKRVIMTVDTEQNARIIRELIACEHIRRRCATGQHISLCLLLKGRGYLQERHYRTECCFLLKSAIAHIHIHRLEHIYHLLLWPHQFLVCLCGYGDENRHVKQILVIVRNAMLNVITGLYGVCQLLIIGTGILHTFDFGAVQSDTLSNLIDGLASVLTSQVYVNIYAFAGIDQC